MKQVLQSLGSGETGLEEVPVPAAIPGHLVVESRASVVSAGTERMLVEFGRSSVLDKARSQPEKVRQVMDRVRTDGLISTVDAVRSKLAQPIPLGYCNAGVVRDAGVGAELFEPGAHVVTNGAHAEYVRVPWTLAARIPAGVSFDAAAFTPLAAIGLNGLRLAQPTLGEVVVVYGLGLVGLLTVQLARANGCRVIGIDPVTARLDLADAFGAEVIDASGHTDVAAAVRSRTGGVGADAVLLTLATGANEPVRAAAEMSRKRGRLVLVGVTGLDLKRSDFYEKELSFQVSCSYGPGRYDTAHEEAAVDYPLPYVRWTEGRNFGAVLQLMAEGRLDPLPLVSHRFAFEQAAEAYDVITGPEPGLGIVLEYAEKTPATVITGRTVELRGVAPQGRARSATSVVGFIGSGNFAARVLIPAFRDAGAVLHTVVSSGGTRGAIAASQHAFRRASTDPESVLAEPAIDTVVIATRHDTHADYVLRALAAGKHVFVEKPLAIRETDVDRVELALSETDRVLCVGFNRRFAPLTLRAKRALDGRGGPLAISITVNAGQLPADHWTKDPDVGGGRLVGEACHFLDLARFFAGHPITNLTVTSALDRTGHAIEDISMVQLAFADGSVASVHYLANGPAGFAKERVELFWDGKGLRIDNFRRIDGWGVPGGRGNLLGRQDKGHRGLVAGFLAAVRGNGNPPIARSEIIESSRWAARTAGRDHRTVGEPADG